MTKSSLARKIRSRTEPSNLRDAVEMETMLAPKDYVQIHQALHFTLGWAGKRIGTEIDGHQVTQEDCDKLTNVIVKVERVLETALKMHHAARDALVAKPDPKPPIYRGVEKKIETRDTEILIPRKEIP